MKNNIHLTIEDQEFLLWLLNNHIEEWENFFSSNKEAKGIINKIESIYYEE